jgi:hypothetical protein
VQAIKDSSSERKQDVRLTFARGDGRSSCRRHADAMITLSRGGCEDLIGIVYSTFKVLDYSSDNTGRRLHTTNRP